VDIECHGGIRLFAVPIFAGGDVIGAINFGYGDPPKDPEKLKMLADAYHLDYDDLLREATAYNSRPPYIIEMAKRRLNTTAKLIGSMVEAKQAMEALREREASPGPERWNRSAAWPAGWPTTSTTCSGSFSAIPRWPLMM
jgi:hypothetical protein